MLSFRHKGSMADYFNGLIYIHKSIQYSDNKSSEYSIHTDIDKNEHAQFSGQSHYTITIKMFHGSLLRPLLDVMFLLVLENSLEVFAAFHLPVFLRDHSSITSECFLAFSALM